MPGSEIVTVVLCYRAPQDAAGAVRSLLEQSEPTEILVVNSGGGDIAAVLRDAGLDVPCLEYKDRLYVGGARNRGITHSTAPYIAFLAADCRACPGWVERRLAAHRAGVRTVASSVVNSHPGSMVANAAYIGMFMRRLPGLPADLAIRFGVSFDRRLFDEFGLFNETIRTGEDTEFLERLPADLKPEWDGEIRTVHLNETRLFSLLADQFGRGMRYGREMHLVFGKPRRRVARDVLRQVKPARRLAAAGLQGSDLGNVMRAIPLLRVMLLVKAAGVLCSVFLPGYREPVAKQLPAAAK